MLLRRHGENGVRARRRIGRRRDRVAFVLSGGGVLGAVQVGQLLALLESGIVPDLLVGTSVGALNATAIAADPTIEGARKLRTVWEALRSEDVFPGGRVQRALHLVRKGDHLYSDAGLRRLIAIVGTKTFEELRRPVSIAATSLRTGTERWFSEGPLEPAILASAALPGVFPPVAVDGELFVDGGVVNNVPISRAVDLGATRVYVLSCTIALDDEPPIRRPLDVFVRAVARSRAARMQHDIARFAQIASIEVMPTVGGPAVRFNDFSQTGRLIAAAADSGRAYLEAGAARTAQR